MWEALFAFHICTACLQPELLRRPVVERTVRALAIVLAPPAGQGAAYVLQRSEPTCIQALVAQPSMETLHMAVLHRPAGLNMHQPDFAFLRFDCMPEFIQCEFLKCIPPGYVSQTSRNFSHS